MNLEPQELAALQKAMSTTTQRLLEHIAAVEAENELLKADLVHLIESRVQKAQEAKHDTT